MRRSLTIASAGMLFAAGAVICRHLFFAEYLRQMGSGDGPLIAMARYTMKHYDDLAWWPLWFCGMPHQNVYGPVLPMMVAGVAAALHFSPAGTLHTLGALFYCLGPVTLFWMAYRFSGSRALAFSIGLIYTTLSPTALLIPSIRGDLGGMFHQRRLFNMVIYGEYPHIAVLCAIPVAVIVFQRMLDGKRAASIAWSALWIAGIAATSVTGSVGFAMVAFAWLLSLPAALYRRAAIRLAIAGLLAYGLALPWIPPSTLGLISMNSQWGTGRPTPFTSRHILYYALIAAGAALLRVALRRMRAPELLRFGLLLVFFSGVVMLPALFSGPAIVPQPLRFQLEFEMGCAIAGGFLLMRIGGWLPSRIPAAIGVCLFAWLVIHNAQHAASYSQPLDVHNTIEYKSAQWFDRNMGDRRVFAPGSVSFWMNAFTDTPQLGGCCDQGVPSWEERVALYAVYTGQNMGAREGPVSLLWLQAFGVHAVEVSGPQGHEWFKPYWNPRKFDGLLPVLWRDAGDVIYQVPQPSDSLAHVMRESQTVSVPGRPRDGLDIAPLEAYVAALNDARFPPARFQWKGQSRARIDTDMAPGDVLSVQVSYHRGWHATAKGVPFPVTSDGLGLMVLHPPCAGACTIELWYDGGSELQAARMAQVLAGLVCLSLVLIRRQPRRVVVQ